MLVARSVIFAVLFLGVCAGCAPRLSPPYRDYEVRTEADSSLTPRLVEAVTEAGWEVDTAAPPGAVTTVPRRFSDGLTSSTEAAIDLVPLDGGYVRIYVRAERRGLLGSRTKVYALSSGLREAVLGPVTEALSARGLASLGTPRDRDEDEVE